MYRGNPRLTVLDFYPYAHKLVTTYFTPYKCRRLHVTTKLVLSILLATLPTLWPLDHGDSDPPYSRKLDTKSGNHTRKWFGGDGGILLTSKYLFLDTATHLQFPIRSRNFIQSIKMACRCVNIIKFIRI